MVNSSLGSDPPRRLPPSHYFRSLAEDLATLQPQSFVHYPSHPFFAQHTLFEGRVEWQSAESSTRSQHGTSSAEPPKPGEKDNNSSSSFFPSTLPKLDESMILAEAAKGGVV